VWRIPEPLPTYIFWRDLTIFGTVWLANIFLIYRYASRMRQLSRAHKFSLRYYESAQNMMIGYRNEMFENFYNIAHLHGALNPSSQELDLFDKICSVVTTRTRNDLKDYFNSRGIDIGEDIAITVKLIINPKSLSNAPLREEDKQKLLNRLQWVKTAYRDPHTHAHFKHIRRVSDDRLYDIAKNTAFEYIHEDGKPYFLSNNLKAIGQSYRNENSDWYKQYNATLVVPIQYVNELTKKTVRYGFLAADSLNKDEEELFDEEGCLYILNHGADLLALWFLTIFLHKHQLLSYTHPTHSSIASTSSSTTSQQPPPSASPSV
jgi:hypothetical protein